MENKQKAKSRKLKAKSETEKAGGKKLKAESLKQKAESMKGKGESKKLKKAKAKEGQVESTIVSEMPDDSFDFGGLPERNLKKNLGCG